jgi:putative oxidoreductase
MSVGRLLLRLVVGGAFIGHGTQKLFGWFGGGGLESTATMFEQIGLRPGRANAVAAGVAETAGGALVAAGLALPAAAAVLTGTMLTAIKRVHLANGPWAANRGYEYNAVLIGAVLALTEAGPGRPSLDHALGRERSGKGWALAALGAGALSAYVVDARARRARAATVPETADTANPVAA